MNYATSVGMLLRENFTTWPLTEALDWETNVASDFKQSEFQEKAGAMWRHSIYFFPW